MSRKNLFEKIEQKLSCEDFVKPADLVACGLFGSDASVRTALKQGILPFIKVSRNRSLIPRQAVVDYIKHNISES